MSTIIDELIVRFGADSSQLEAKGKAADKTLKGVDKSSKDTEGSVKKLGETSKKASSGIDSLSGSLAKFLALLGGTYALKAFIEDTIASSAALERLSRNLNESAGQITAWGNVVEQGGGSAKGLQSTLMMLSKEQTNLALTGQSSLIPMFNMLGVSMFNAQGQALKSTEILKQLAAATQGKDRRTMFNLLTSNGIDEGTANALLRGRKELELNLAAQKNYAEQISKFAPVAEQMQRSLIKIKQNFTLLGLELLQKAAPAIEKLIGVLDGLSNWVQTHGQFIGDLAKILGAVAAGLTLIAVASSPITLTVGVVLALAGAIALLWEDYQKWKSGGNSLINWAKWKPDLDNAIASLKELRNILGDIASAIKIVNQGLHGDSSGANAASAKLHDRVMEHLGFKKDSAPIADAFRNFFRSKDDQIQILADGQKAGNFFKTPIVPPQALAGRNTLVGAISQVEGFNAPTGNTPNRPQRNHNPGDIEYGEFAKAHGATGSDGRFAIFPDDATGQAALAALLQSDKYSGLTIGDAIKKFAPPKENNTQAYIDSVVKATGFSANTKIGDALRGMPGAASTTQSAIGAGGSAGAPTDNSTSIHIDQATINTKATDAVSMFQDVKNFSYGFTAQANGGLR